MDAVGAITAVGSLATAGAVLVAYSELRLQRLVARTQFEDELSKEYRQLIKPEVAPALFRGEVKASDAESLYPPVLQYVDLSNEEVYLRSRGRISDEAWENWRDGIAINLDRFPFKQHWARIRDDAIDDFLELRLLVDTDFFDPLAWTPRHKRRWPRRAIVGVEEAASRLEHLMREKDAAYWRELRKKRQRGGASDLDDSQSSPATGGSSRATSP